MRSQRGPQVIIKYDCIRLFLHLECLQRNQRAKVSVVLEVERWPSDSAGAPVFLMDS